MRSEPGEWTVVLPVKGGAAAKSRLRASGRRAPGPGSLAAAIAADCLDAVLASTLVGRVLVVTADDQAAADACAAGATVVAERRPGAGLVAAVLDGAAAAGTGPVAVLLGDLPALRPEDLTAALGAVETALAELAPMAAVPDADGRGTVLLAARSGCLLDPAFGTDSFDQHVRRGAVPLPLALPRLRRDVDTLADLEAALALGCGPRTTALAAADRSAPCLTPP